MLNIDHIMIGTDNIERTIQHLRDSYGLSCFQGGLHSDGTRTWVIPLGSKYVHYIEILTIEEPEQANKDFFGRWLLERVKDGESIVGWALQTDEIASICQRLNLKPWTGSVTRPDGSSSSWTEAGFEQVATSGWMPFFIAYNDLPARRERAKADLLRVHHAIEPSEIAWIELGGSQEQLHAWLGDSDLAVRIVSDKPGIYGIGIQTAQGEISIR